MNRGRLKINRQIIRKTILLLGVFFFLVLAFFLLLHYVNIKKNLLNLSISKGYISLNKIDYKYYKNGVIYFEIFAKSLIYSSPKKNIIMLHNVKILIYGKDMKPKYIITGKSGRLNAASKNVRVSGDVTIKSSAGSYMKTEKLYYFSKDGKIFAPGDVKIKGKNYSISGTGMLFFANRKIFILQKDVNVTYIGVNR